MRTRLLAFLTCLTVAITSCGGGDGYDDPTPSGPSTSTTIYQKGTIIVDVVQRAAKRGIWRGSVVTRIEQERKLEDRVKRINEAMDRIFQRFPIKPRS